MNENFKDYVFLVRLYGNTGWVDYYQPTTIKKLRNLIKMRGCEKLVIKDNQTHKYTELKQLEFKEIFENTYNEVW